MKISKSKCVILRKIWGRRGKINKFYESDANKKLLKKFD